MLLIESSYSVPQTLEYHDVLNPAIWDADMKMKPDVRAALLRVADNYIETLAPYIDAGNVVDVRLTGSNANYNYTPGSDCDVHIILHYPNEIYEDFAQAKKTVWNTQHSVSIHGFPVEIYPQSDDEALVTGSGWYSITKDDWLQKPVYQDNVDVTNPAIRNIADKVSRQIEFAMKYNVTDMATLHRLGQKIWGLRDQAKKGEFSINNLAFKELRNAGWTEKYINYLQTIQNKELSL